MSDTVRPMAVPAAGAVAVRGSRARAQPALLGVIAVGGLIGACLRYGAALAWPTSPGGFPATTLAVNTVGCAAMGALMALITAAPSTHPLVRPLLGTGVLGGFTTFSTYALDGQRLRDAGRAGIALAYVAGTVAAALAAVAVGQVATRLGLRALRRLVAAVGRV
ncbi:fluoride efflux transporter CrcB [Pseudofrankia sp. DC12]|uniref:fluoride efflux transporter CrcB n=1 Tax=Pseudofrankia sp. DC12 TaxID=683315 RepID=UPI000B05F777|nr:fluoride efflux transporter CrcB [Pseudofrankia sp. DC12]